MNLVIAAGGTGGHIIPALAVALLWRTKGHKVIWFGRENSMESNIANQHHIPFYCVGAMALGRMTKMPKNLLNISKAISKAGLLLRQHKAFCVFSTGSYASFPTAMAAYQSGIPLFIHEQNSVMGMANKVLLPFAKGVFLGMPIWSLPQNWVVGSPLLKTPTPSNGQHLLVFAGSQAADFFNQNIPQILAKLKVKYPIIHIAGKDKELVKKAYQRNQLNAEVIDFSYDMDTLFKKSKIGICRAGAMSLAEIAGYQLPSVVVPYQYASGDHQTKNALMMENKNCVVVACEDITSVEMAVAKLLVPNNWKKMRLALATPYQHGEKKIVQEISKLYARALSH